MNDEPDTFIGKNLVLEDAELEGVQVIRDPQGHWRYMETGIRVPGAQDVTLTERFQPKVIISQEGNIERVIVDGASIKAHPELLDWCLSEGTPIRKGDELVEVIVPYELWEEQDRVPHELIAPERDGNEAQRDVATAERQYREAEKALERAAEVRADVLRFHADDMTRAEARDITGLSVGRIQQLIRSEQLEKHEREMLEMVGDGPIEMMKELQNRAREKGMPADEDLLMNLVRDLEARNLMDYEDGVGLYLTKEGTETLFAAQMTLKRSGADEE